MQVIKEEVHNPVSREERVDSLKSLNKAEQVATVLYRKLEIIALRLKALTNKKLYKTATRFENTVKTKRFYRTVAIVFRMAHRNPSTTIRVFYS